MKHANFILLVLILAAISGCAPSKHSSIETSKYPSFIQVNKPKDCECIPVAVRFARASLGLDLTKETLFDNPEGLLKSLNEEASLIKSVITQHDIAECLDELADRPDPGPCEPILLVHPLGHIYFLLGTVYIENVLTYQILHGDSAVWLIDRENLDKAGFTDAWRFHKINEEVPVQFAGSCLSIDRMYENFGKVAPQTELVTEFTFKNTGNVPLVFETEASCRCTVLDDFENTDLLPGDSRNLKITFLSSVGTAERHSVYVTCYEKGTGFSTRIELLLLASQQQTMKVEPTRLNFGEVQKGEIYKRIINLTEVPTDRFNVTNFDPNGNPIRGIVNTVNKDSELKTYQVELEFTPNGTIEDRTSSTFVIETNSLLRPYVRVPYEFILKSGIYAEPSMVSLGNVELGQSIEKEVKLISAEKEDFHCSVVKQPEDCSIVIHEGKGVILLELNITPESKGVMRRRIELLVESKTKSKDLVIEYIGYVK